VVLEYFLVPYVRCTNTEFVVNADYIEFILLSTHADRQGIDISVTVCVFLYLCTVANFSAVDKASGVKFGTAVHRRLRQGISHFGELCLLPQKPKIERIGERAGHAHPNVNISVEMGCSVRGILRGVWT